MAINRNNIINNLSEVKLSGDKNGLINAFGVQLNQFSPSIWSNFAERLTHSVSSDLLKSVETMLINAAHECGYHTGYGILTSNEWSQIVAPNIGNTTEDILHGTYALVTGFGWADAEIVELIPSEKMLIHVHDYYESDTVDYGKSNKFNAYTLTGISAAFMDLAYGGEYNKGLFTYKCEQIKGIEKGDKYGEFIVTKA